MANLREIGENKFVKGYGIMGKPYLSESFQ